MRPTRVSLAVAAVLTAAPLATASPAGTARSGPPLSRGGDLPAPVTVETGSQRFQIARDGRVHGLPPRVLPFPRDASWFPGTGAWYAIRRRHLVVGRWRRMLWRSRGEYPRLYEIGVVTMGAHTVAFSYRSQGAEQLYVAALGGVERHVARNEFPLGRTRGGFYAFRYRGRELLLRSDTGALAQTVVRAPRTYAYDWTTETLYFIARGRLWRAYGSAISPMASLARVGLPARKPSVELTPLGRLVELLTNQRLTLLNPDGSLFAETRLRTPDGSLAGNLGVAGDLHAVAFASQAASHPGARRGTQTVYVLRAGAHAARALHDEPVDFTCGTSTGLQWHGRWLLYSATGGYLAVIDSTGRRAGPELTRIARRIERFPDGDFTAYWSDRPPPL